MLRVGGSGYVRVGHGDRTVSPRRRRALDEELRRWERVFRVWCVVAVVCGLMIVLSILAQTGVLR